MMGWRETRVPQAECPKCGSTVNEAGSPEGHSPAPGDLTICYRCASVLEFTKSFGLHALTQAELAALDSDLATALRLYQRAVLHLHRRS